MSICISCQQPTNKYKCPKCLEPYCSVDCYKAHKTQQCQEKPRFEPTPPDNEPTIHDPFTTEDTVPHEKLQQLRDSDGLRQRLYNPHLRNLLNEIDVAPNAWKAIRAAMHEPLFVEFADECLKVIEPTTNAAERPERIFEEFLQL